MLGLSATYNYYLFNGNVDMRKGIFRRKHSNAFYADLE